MFVRFVANVPHPNIDADLGMFAARDEIDFSRFKGSVQRANEEAFYWFLANHGMGLTFPRLKGKARSADVRRALFWFREDATFSDRKAGRVVDRARQLAQALTLADCEIRELKTRDPGQIVWEDTKQVLAVPSKDLVLHAFS